MTIDDRPRTDVGPILSDGTPFADLFDLDKHEVSMRLLKDPEVYRLELSRLFGKAWTVLAHETEIPNAFDYVARHIGADPVIVTRSRSGDVNVVLNICSHRGMQVCRGEAGNEKQFKCPYHGWSFSEQGKFMGSPVARENMHGAFRSKEELALPKARVELYAGFVFATWDEDAPSLDDYLGEIKFYQDLMFDRTESGLEVLGPPQRFVIPANWKCPGEQHAGDGYHAMTLHRSINELAASEADDSSMYGIDVSANGHGLRLIDRRKGKWKDNREAVLAAQTLPPFEKLKSIMLPPGMTPEMAEKLDKKLSEAQMKVLADYPPSVGGLFPNMGTFCFEFPTPMGMAAIISWHAFVPRGPGKFEFINWFLVEKDAPEDFKDLMRRASTLGLGTTGFVETDDADTWPLMTESAEGFMGEQQKIRYGALCGEDQPLDGYWDEGEFPGGGHLYPGFTKDDAQWNWWLRYRDFMLGDPWGPEAHH
ncbi:Rieske 2Fe-2S domain-containing protein [Janibacter terrae]|jgi:phenylpropionate dioxygenase-like ring-hydroxylating dioxygenase large terminal subunit|uniref:Aromatic ring-hydroxylating dioxygenase subunit alpha n=2 Tax=Janibacter TaxID=53457 RepID=A0A4P6MU04_9MICO|nr:MULTISPECIES: Rieske 2Fe-2S domain-containing protein [Janibacter]MBA4084245.1 aromatic ring-hydroxylating dioxygenase subunit alpha [Kytococcus sp.]QBF47144.1 aromatic ring-hydroxylating dioxygenase subunit alpha [Janibacter limosus]